MSAFIPPLAGFIVTSLMLVFSRPVAERIGLVDRPGGRKRHESTATLVGGISIFAGLMTLSITNLALFHETILVLSLATLLVVLGAIDDIFGLASLYRLAIQILVGLIIYYFGGLQFSVIADFGLSGGPIETGPVAPIVTVIAVVGGANAINMMDGLDGLVGSLLLSTLFFLGVLALSAGAMDVLTIVAVLGAAIFAFLLFNFRFPWIRQARVFLGDGGTYALGFFMTALFLHTTQEPGALMPPILALWIMAIPLLDIAHVVVCRLRLGRPPFKDDRLHVHYILRDLGIKDADVVNLLCLVHFLLGALGVTLFYAELSEGWLFGGFLLVCGVYFLSMSYAVSRTQASLATDRSPTI